MSGIFPYQQTSCVMKQILILSLIIISTTSFSQDFTEIDAGLPGVENGSLAWGDYDNDGDLDILLTGYSSSVAITKIYRNDSTLRFVDIEASIVGICNGWAEWGDYDNDGDLDIILTGKNNDGNSISKIYRNEGTGNFIDVNANLIGLQNGKANWGDYNNDGYLDIIIVGGTNTGTSSAKSIIYRNNGDETFTDINANIASVYFGSAKWGDYDKDGDLDILITGNSYENNSTLLSKIYRNDGNDSFTDINAELDGVQYSSGNWGDYDGDGDLDILLTGYSYENGLTLLSKIYRNDGNQIFNEINTSIVGLYNGFGAWGDYDNDGDLDILLSGNSAGPISTIFRNDANSFVDANVELKDVKNSSGAWGDYDNDGDLDLIIAGKDNTGEDITRIYKNESSVINTPPVAPADMTSEIVGNKKILLKWNHSNDDFTSASSLTYNVFIGKNIDKEDIKSSMSNISTGFRKIARFGDIVDTCYTINKVDSGKYYWAVQAIDNSFLGSTFSVVDSFNVTLTNEIMPVSTQVIEPNVNGDTLFVHETGNPDTRQWRYSLTRGGPYENVLTGEIDTFYVPNFPELGVYYIACESVLDGKTVLSNEVKIRIPVLSPHNEISLQNPEHGSSAWGDFDNDGDLDLLVTGRNNSYPFTILYRNDSADFVDVNASLINLECSSVDWGDYNNDGFLDILLIGKDNTDLRHSLVYKNNGDGTFSIQTNIVLEGVSNGQAAWCDLNLDGKCDIIISGTNNQAEAKTYIYRNIGNNSFTQIDNQLRACYNGDFDIGDYDNDGLKDIILVGDDINGNDHATIYKNEGNYIFSTQVQLLEDSYATVEFGDYDNDGDLDVYEAGSDQVSRIYRNDGDNNFVNIEANIQGFWHGAGKWGDFDNDGDLDLIIAGSYIGENVTCLYENTGNNTFEMVSNVDLLKLDYPIISWADYDNDKDLDLFLSGSYSSENSLYKNHNNAKNTKPAIPTGLIANVNGQSVSLTWNEASDSETPKEGLTYNIYVGTTSKGIDIIPSNSDHNTGFHKITDFGNVGSDTVFSLDNLVEGTYYWSVQTIDKSGLASEFAIEKSFQIDALFTKHEIDITIKPYSMKSVWGDIDNDNDLDCIIYGNTNGGTTNETYLMINEGNNVFNELTNTGFMNLNRKVLFFDFDLDNYLDVIMCDWDSLKLYRNNGDKTFTDQSSAITCPGPYYGQMDIDDYNNDGYPDIIITANSKTRILKNNGNGTFSENNNAQLKNLLNGTTDWIDYNSDGYVDIIVTGGFSGEKECIVYKNNGNHTFDEQENINLTGLSSGAIAFGDYDNDLDVDIVITGKDANDDVLSKIYKNNGQDSFVDIQADIRAVVYYSNISWVDFNNDGLLDIIMSGESSNYITKIYENTGDDTFSEIESNIPDNRIYPNSVPVDADNDGGIDISFMGYGDYDYGIYHNNYYTGNTPPKAPINLHAEPNRYGIKLTWDRTTDLESSEGGLSYNVMVRKDSAWGDIVNPLSDTSGYRKITKIGNAQYRDFFYLDSLPVGTYFWRVQAIDQSFMGGEWSEESTFEITRLRPYFSADTVCFGDSTTLTNQSIFTGTEIAQYEWNFSDTTYVANDSCPKRVFNSAGKHYVTLIITDTAGVTQSVTDTIFVSPRPEAIISATDVCFGSPTAIFNNSETDTLAIQQWEWNFGDSETNYYEQYPGAHQYLDTGIYEVQLTIFAENGCMDSAGIIATVAGYPNANISTNGNSEFCDGDTLKLSVPYNSYYTYNWIIGTASQQNSNSNIFYATEEGNHTVSVTNERISPGCTTHSIDTIEVTTKSTPEPFNITIVGDTTFCSGDSVLLMAPHNDNYIYDWKLAEEDAGYFVFNNESATIFNSGAYTARAIQDECEAFASDTILVTAIPAPTPVTITLEGSTTFCEGDSVRLSINKQDGFNLQWYENNNPISADTTYFPKETGNFYVSFSNGTMCSYTTPTVEVQKIDYPNPDLETDGDTLVCPDDGVIFRVENNADYTYTWQQDGVTIPNANSHQYTAVEEGKYTVDINNSGCEISTSPREVLHKPAPPKPNLIAEGPNVWILACSNDSALNYKWYYNGELIPGETDHIHIANQNLGDYYVTISDGRECPISSNILTIPLGTGISDVAKFGDIKIYPNPTPGVFNIEMNNQLIGKIYIRITNLNGKELFNLNFQKHTRHFQTQMDLSGQGKGIYLIEFRFEKDVAVRKLVVE